jgi:hypothetical protein
MKLVPVSTDDLPLYVSCFCDEKHMAELGGPQPEEKVWLKLSHKLFRNPP